MKPRRESGQGHGQSFRKFAVYRLSDLEKKLPIEDYHAEMIIGQNKKLNETKPTEPNVKNR